jgi:hypothetical protein
VGFELPENVIDPLYIAHMFGIHVNFQGTHWESHVLPIMMVQCVHSALLLDTWRNHDKNGGCPILWDDPDLQGFYTAVSPIEDDEYTLLEDEHSIHSANYPGLAPNMGVV